MHVHQTKAQIETLHNYRPSPEAASLAEVEDIPVGLHTGTPNFSETLYTIGGRSLELKVRLRHNGRAVRAADIPGWVGLGWSLNAGGTITRSMRGLPDDHADGYERTGDKIMEGYYDITSASSSDMSDPGYQIDPLASLNSDLADRVKNDDSEPDLFIFNFAGYSGKFVIDGERSEEKGEVVVRTLKGSDFKIEMTDSGARGFKEWKITDVSGTEFVFSAEEESLYIDENHQYYSSWHLTKIKSPRGEVFELKYTNEDQNEVTGYYQPVLESRSVLDTENCRLSQPDRRNSPYVEHFRRHIDYIETDDQIIDFNTSIRDDLRNQQGEKQARKLDSIVVRKKREPGKDLLQRTIRFDYFYFSTTDPSGQRNTYPSFPTSGKRLGLRSVEVVGHDERNRSWTFQYYKESVDLESRFSRDIDHWGYPNGASNSTLIPTTNLTDDVTVGSADRSSATDASTLLPGALKKIRHPTGGTTTFEYELNDYGYVEYNAIHEPIVDSVEKEAYESEYPHAGERSEKKVSSTTFEVSSDAENQLLRLKAKTPDVKDGNSCKTISGNDDNLDGECAIFRLKNTSTGNEEVYRSNQEAYFTSESPTYKESISLDTGTTYKITTELYFYTEDPDDSSGNCPNGFDDSNACTAYIKVSWEEPTGEYKKTRIGGGLRVSRVTQDDGLESTEPEVKRFRYQVPSDPSRSSGVLVTKPRYYFNPNGVMGNHELWIVGGKSMPKLGRSQGSAVGYQWVQVLYGPDNANGEPQGGSTTYHFTTSKLDRNLNTGYDHPNPSTLPFSLQVLRPWKYGLERSSNTRDADSTTRRKKFRQLVLTDENPRETPPRFDRVLGIRHYSVQVEGCQTSSLNWYGWYETSNGFTYPHKVTVSHYSDDGSVRVANTTEKTYGNLSHHLPTRKSVSTTNGRSRTTRYKYAHEQYPQMDASGSHQLSQKYRTTVFEDADNNGQVGPGETVWKRSWTDWTENIHGHWVPESEWVWTEESDQ